MSDSLKVISLLSTTIGRLEGMWGRDKSEMQSKIIQTLLDVRETVRKAHEEQARGDYASVLEICGLEEEDITYTEGTFEAATIDGNRFTTQATLASNGLCYHAARGAKMTRCEWLDSAHEATEYADAYSVSHIASGYMLCGNAEPFQTEEQCRQFITRIDSLADWSSAAPTLSDEVKQQVYACRDEVVREGVAR